MTQSRLVAATVFVAALLLVATSDTRAKPSLCAAWKNVVSPGVGLRSGLSGVAARSATDMWAVGWTEDTDLDQRVYAQHWDGREWSSVATPDPPPSQRLTASALFDVAVAGKTDVWAVGRFLNDEGAPSALVMRWDGSRFSITPVPPAPRAGEYQLRGVAAVSSTDVWAVGSAGGQPLVLHWDGATWRLWPTPTLSRWGSALLAVDARGPRDVWAVGYRGTRTGNVPLALHWKGRRWSVVPIRGLRVRGGELTSVAVTASGKARVVGWHFPRRAAGEVTLAARWTGRSWRQEPIPNRKYWDNRVEDVAISPSGQPWAVGFVAWDVDKKVLPVAFRWSKGRWRRANVEYAGYALFFGVDVVGRSDGAAVGYGPSGVFTQRLRRC